MPVRACHHHRRMVLSTEPENTTSPLPHTVFTQSMCPFASIMSDNPGDPGRCMRHSPVNKAGREWGVKGGREE